MMKRLLESGQHSAKIMQSSQVSVIPEKGMRVSFFKKLNADR